MRHLSRLAGIVLAAAYRAGLLLLYLLVLPPLLFVMLSPLLALFGDLSGFYKPQAVGEIVKLIFAAGAILPVVVGVMAAILAGILRAICWAIAKLRR